ncbi:hypothetical protein [uncultured Butyricimonas sp.]|uniref:hypothetical protein n=1 Tax=uncultured Butyricimonas sp. TaxID=1268785 RepID=UPI0026DBE5E5|nr:hypothetical protein [uncultured Butyricimonas sp.]
MKEDHEIMSDEELKQFFLNEAMLLCPSAREDVPEHEKLQILYNTQQKIVKLLRVMNHCQMEMHYVEVYHVYGYYFMEKEGEKRKKRKMSERLEHYGQFMYQLTKMKCIIGHYYAYSLQHLRSMERIIELYFPGILQNKMKTIPGEQHVTIEEEEQEK